MAEVAIASPMLPKSLALFGDLAAHREFLDEAELTGGLELHPIRGSVLCRELGKLAAIGDPEAADIIRSGHQSYVSSAAGMMPHETIDQVAQSLLALAVFPGAEASLQELSRYQDAVSQAGMPVVVYPEIGRPTDYHDLPFSEKLFQPNVRNLKKWGIRTTEELIERAVQEGLTGIAWDGYHYLRTNPTDALCMPDWQDALPQLLESSMLPVKEVHVSLGRVDRTEDTSLMEMTKQEMDIFLSTPQQIDQTVTGKMLRMIHNSTNGAMRYVLEAKPAKTTIPRDMSLKTAYRALAHNIASFLDS